MGRSKRPGRTGRKGNGLKGRAIGAAKNALVDKALDDYFDASEIVEEAENNKFGPTDTVLDLGDWEVVATPGGPSDPWDCHAWPDSIWCGGGWEKSIVTFGLADIAADGCGIMVAIEWRVLGFGMPTITFGLQSTDPNCRPEPEEEEPEEPPPGGGIGMPPVPWPSILNQNFLYALTFQLETYDGSFRYATYFAWGPVAIIPGPVQFYDPGPGFEPFEYFRIYYLLCKGFSSPNGGVNNIPRVGNRTFAPDGIDKYDHLSFPRLVPITQNTFRVAKAAYSLRQPSIGGHTQEQMNGWYNHSFYPFDFYGPLDPGKITLVKAEAIGCNGRYSQSYLSKVKFARETFYEQNGYAGYPKDDWSREWLKLLGESAYGEYIEANIWPSKSNSKRECLVGSRKPKFDGWGQVRKGREENIMGGCCEITLANYRMLKRIYAVIAPEELRKFTPSGEPIGKPVCTIPSYFIYPDSGDIPAYIDNYPKLAMAMLLMADKNAFIPFDVQIPDVSAGQKGNQPLNLRFTNFSAALKELLQLLIDTESDVDDGNNIAVRQSYELMVMHQLLVKIYCLVEGSADYLGYEMQQKVEKVPMMFTADSAKQKKTNKKLDSNTEEAVESLMPQLLQVSEQPVVVERNVQSKDLNETLLEILNLLQARNAGYTQKA